MKKRHYHKREKGKPCWWCPPILILDFLCQRSNPVDEHCYMLYVTSFGFYVVFLFNSVLEEWFGHDFMWVLATPGISMFWLDNLYRHLRNKYLKKHNLPGPYGYGSIDHFPHFEDE